MQFNFYYQAITPPEPIAHILNFYHTHERWESKSNDKVDKTKRSTRIVLYTRLFIHSYISSHAYIFIYIYI